MSAPRFHIAVPWWARLIGWWRRRRFEKADRAAKLKAHTTEVYVGTIIGQTRWVDKNPPLTQNTHRWDFYESPAGSRSVKFISMRYSSLSRDGSDHSRHALVVTPWLNHKFDVSWDKMREDGDLTNVWGRRT